MKTQRLVKPERYGVEVWQSNNEWFARVVAMSIRDGAVGPFRTQRQAFDAARALIKAPVR